MDINQVISNAIAQAFADIKEMFSARNNIPNIDYLNNVSFYFKDGVEEAENSFVLGGMETLMDDEYEIYIHHETMMDLIHDNEKWFSHCKESDPSFYNYSEENERLIAIIVETIYHEVRHTLSVERIGATKYQSEYNSENIQNGYWQNRFERSARAMQKQSVTTINKILPLLKEVDE